MAQFEKLTAPTQGTPVRFENGQPVVANDPIIPFIRGDGTGVDIWPATQKVLDAAVAKAYSGAKRIEWFKVYAGDEACDLYGTYQYLPRRHPRGDPHLRRRHQGPPHHSSGRRDPVVERGPTPDL